MSGLPPRAVIFGCAGPVLSPVERDFFAAAHPAGFILFQRNCESPEQIRELTADLRAAVRRPDAPVLIDQEGGRVQRLRPPHWRQAPPAAIFAALARQDLPAATRAAWINARLIAAELEPLGVTVDCAPVLDIPVPGAHDVIGDRAYGDDPEIVAALGLAVCEGLMSGGVLPVIKHIPGHGRSLVDSHHDCPVVTASAGEMEKVDLPPFRSLASQPFAMTAHIVYRAWDDAQVATFSPEVIARIIRGWIGFDGALMSDDLSMKALGGDFASRARRSIAAGCDMVLHCNGDLDEMHQVLEGTPRFSAAGLERWERALAARQPPQAADNAALLEELAALLSKRES